MMRRLPIRLRLSLGFAAAMALLLAALAAGLYTSMSAALLDELDSGMRSRAATLETDLPHGLGLATPTRTLVESREAFAQVFDAAGRVIESSPGHPTPALEPDIVRRVFTTSFFERTVPGVENVARILAVTVGTGAARKIVVVASSMADRADALRQLVVLFAAGGPVALLIASLAGWMLAGAALTPVERMRSQASEMSRSSGRRLAVPAANDEIRRLAETLNEMLSRFDESSQKERRFLDDASHELRTPLTALKAELDVARSRPRSAEELTRALASASDETDRLARMAEDLLVLSRAHGGVLPIRRTETELGQLLSAAAALFDARAASAGVTIKIGTTDGVAFVDGVRVRQAVDNLLDNALRFTPRGGTVLLAGRVDEGRCEILVEDTGPGFPAGFARAAPEPFRRGAAGEGMVSHDGAGLGLAIVRAVAESHGGSVEIETNPGGGARVRLSLA